MLKKSKNYIYLYTGSNNTKYIIVFIYEQLLFKLVEHDSLQHLFIKTTFC